MECNYCGNPNSPVVDTKGICSCARCFNSFGTCRMCTHGNSCEFETNLSPLPKQVQHTIHKGNMVIQQVIKNPERVQQLCVNCPCYDTEWKDCCKEYGTCQNYKEVEPNGVLYDMGEE